MTTTVHTVESFEIRREMLIAAPLQIAFQTILDVLGPEGEMPDGKPFPMKIEPWPGGRWYRDLGDDAGHLWGYVQAIKPPTLIEICGPLMMSTAAANNLQYRLTADGDNTQLVFHHRCAGLLVSGYQEEGIQTGWDYWLEHMKDLSERRNQ
jgi:uncharacterized protein YndB with AHSA1/START domain